MYLTVSLLASIVWACFYGHVGASLNDNIYWTFFDIQDENVENEKLQYLKDINKYKFTIFNKWFYAPDIYEWTNHVKNLDECLLICLNQKICVSGNYLHVNKRCMLSKSVAYDKYEFYPHETSSYFFIQGSDRNLKPATQLYPGVSPQGCGKPAKMYHQHDNSKRGKRVVNGKVPKFYSRPWVAIITDYYDSLMCSGALIQNRSPHIDRNFKSNTILTAAHCLVRKVNDTDRWMGKYTYANNGHFSVLLGKMDRNFKEAHEISALVRTFIIHDDYDPYNLDYDIAIIKLDRYVYFNDYIRPICLPHFAQEYTEIPKECFVSGWGLTEVNENSTQSTILHELDVIINKDITAYRLWNGELDMTSNICAMDPKSKGKCFSGDSGAPLVCWSQLRKRYIAYGLVSAGKINDTYLPDRFVRLSNVMAWINENA